MFCENCGKPVEDNSDFCMECGTKISTQDLIQPQTQLHSSKIKPKKVSILAVIISIFIIPMLVLSSLVLTNAFKPYDLSISQVITNNSDNSSHTATSSNDDIVPAVNPSDITFTCTASSYQTTKHGYYSASNANDKDTTTTWIEGSSDYGIGEWLQLDFFDEYVISGISLINGYAFPENNYNRYKRNARLKRIKIETSDGYTKEAMLHDGITGFQDIYFDNPTKTSYVKITILDVYEGDTDKFSCISEVKLI